MKIYCTASKDTYITNKIIDSKLVADDANVGRAGTLDLFRLYGETLLRGSGSQDEVSRLLIKFDFAEIKSLTSSIVDLNSSNFSARLKLFDVRSGHAVPSDFNVVVFPLSRSFDEGVGRDISSFGDIDAANFITTFSNSPCWPNYCLRQSYPDTYPFENNPTTGAYQVDLEEVCYNNFFGGKTTLYKIEKGFKSSGKNIILRFYDELFQPNAIDKDGVPQQKCDESWSLDNLTVRVVKYR